MIALFLGLSGGLAQAQQGGYGGGCWQAPRLTVGGRARVTLYPDLPNRIRNSPAFSDVVIGLIPAGAAFNVLAGPLCDGRIHWWQVSYSGIVGWTIEGDGAYTYYLEPTYTPPPPPPPVCTLPQRLSIGTYARVTPGLPNTVRSGAGAAGTQRIGTIPAGGQFSVIGGPQCAPDGRWWWYVNYRGLIGWTAEGDPRQGYWLEPAAAPGPTCLLPNRLYVGGWGRVTPGLPNVMRDAPGTRATGSNSSVIGYIPAGAIFRVLEGPQCGTDNRWWWRVDYNGFVGWTGEGEGSSTYWVEPF
jgi:hypothetical protein